MRRRRVPEGIRPTKVGVWFVCLCLLVGVAATNTGNNALYMVLALMLGTLVVSGMLSRNNVRRVEVAVTPPEEVFAGDRIGFRVHLHNQGRLTPRWLLLVSLSGQERPTLCSYLPPGVSRTVLMEIVFGRRGRHRIQSIHLATLFPLGLFRKGMRQQLDLDVLVYPRVRPGGRTTQQLAMALGSYQDRRRGWGHELHSLRRLRPGDDPRRIHWKQSARTGKMIFMERQAEHLRRVSVVVDNALDPSDGLEADESLERRISEGASAALDYLDAGFQVELITRTVRVPFDGGARQRRRVLEALALLEAAEPTSEPLTSGEPLELRFDARSLEVST